jgi:hypothetical protein
VLRKIWLSSAVILGLGSLAVVGAPMVMRPAMVAGTALPQSVADGAKADSVASAADYGQAGHDVLRTAMNEMNAATQMAPLIFAPSSGVAEPLMPASDDSASSSVAAAPAVPAANDNEANAKQPAGNWRDANAKADVSETEAEIRKPARKEHVRKPRVTAAARDKPAGEPQTVQPKTCVQPTGFNSFLASLNLKPRCET